MAGFFRIWILRIELQARPLYEATKRPNLESLDWNWRLKRAFQTPQQILTEATALGLPNLKKSFTLYVAEKQGGVCTFINETSCIYINTTSQVEENIKEIYNQAKWLHETAKENATANYIWQAIKNSTFYHLVPSLIRATNNFSSTYNLWPMHL